MKSLGGIWVNRFKYKIVKFFEEIDGIYLKGVNFSYIH